MPTIKITNRRRERVKAHAQATRVGWLGRFSHQRRLLITAIVSATLLAVFAAVMAGQARDPERVGEWIDAPRIARVSFEVEDAEATRESRLKAVGSAPLVLRFNEQRYAALIDALDGMVQTATRGDFESLDPAEVEKYRLTPEACTTLRGLGAQSDAEAAEPAWRVLRDRLIERLYARAVVHGSTLEAMKRHAAEGDAAASSLPMRGKTLLLHKPPLGSPALAGESGEANADPIADPAGAGKGPNSGLNPGITTAASPRVERVSADALLTAESRDAISDWCHRSAMVLPDTIRAPAAAALVSAMGPTYDFDEKATVRQRDAAADAVEPVRAEYRAGDVLVKAGTRLTPTQAHLLHRESAAYADALGLQMRALRWLSRLVVAGVVGAGLWLYLLAFYPRLGENPLRAASMTALLMAALAVSVLATPLSPRLESLTLTLPAMIAVLVLCTAYDQRMALGVGIVQTVLVALTVDLPLWLFLTLGTGVAAACGLLDEVRTRSTLVRVGLYAGAAMGVMALASGWLLRPLHLTGEATRVWQDALVVLGSGLGAGVIVQAMLPGLERACGVVTAMKLKELNDASHPLLRRMAQEASGTYQHSLCIADMAEAAAEAIGADALLCRVGAMYHDIGKINKPDYFIENQGGGPNQHDRLSPAMSQLIIVGHVKDGVEMAREYNLPPAIRHFIESHHGTSLVAYFYHAARKQTEAQGKEAPSEFEFRYPGPKPQTREAAIMMVCDGVESAARSLSEPTPIRLEQLVHKIAGSRLGDGQFDECNLTLRELHRIEEAVTKTVRAVYHARIKYPDQKKDAAKDQPATSQAG